MEHGTGAHRAREGAVRRLARVRPARHAADRLRERVRGTLERLARPWARLRAAYARALARVAGAVRRARARRHAERVLVAWSDPVTPTADLRAAAAGEVAARLGVDVSRVVWVDGHPGTSSTPTPIYGQAPSRIGFTDEGSPESGSARMSTNSVDIAQHHRLTAPIQVARSARAIGDHITDSLRSDHP